MLRRRRRRRRGTGTRRAYVKRRNQLCIRRRNQPDVIRGNMNINALNDKIGFLDETVISSKGLSMNLL